MQTKHEKRRGGEREGGRCVEKEREGAAAKK
jgi:hypothetical protein